MFHHQTVKPAAVTAGWVRDNTLHKGLSLLCDLNTNTTHQQVRNTTIRTIFRYTQMISQFYYVQVGDQ